MRWYWKLHISKDKKVEIASWGWDDESKFSGPIVGETLTCKDKAGFEVIGSKRKDGSWGKWIKKITFDFEPTCKGVNGKAECNIKIADTVGLKNSCENL